MICSLTPSMLRISPIDGQRHQQRHPSNQYKYDFMTRLFTIIHLIPLNVAHKPQDNRQSSHSCTCISASHNQTSHKSLITIPQRCRKLYIHVNCCSNMIYNAHIIHKLQHIFRIRKQSHIVPVSMLSYPSSGFPYTTISYSRLSISMITVHFDDCSPVDGFPPQHVFMQASHCTAFTLLIYTNQIRRSTINLHYTIVSYLYYYTYVFYFYYYTYAFYLHYYSHLFYI